MFAEDSYANEQNEQQYHMYYMNRDGFTFKFHLDFGLQVENIECRHHMVHGIRCRLPITYHRTWDFYLILILCFKVAYN